MRFRLAKNYVAGQIYPRRGAAGGFLNFKMILQLLITLTETRPFREKGWKLPRFSRQPLGNALKGCWIAAKYCYQGIEMPLGNAQRLLESLWAILKGYWKAAGKCPNTAISQQERRCNCLAAIGKNVAISVYFL